ncbi:MAG: ATP-binding protein [Gammaproteobacteria bacterium]|nr:MAG: ATP-binding protein [Gammaproteobacteria bacterium]
MSEARLRLAVSGTYGTGKTTTTEALAIATGLSGTHARTARELLAEDFPGKTLEDLSASELIRLGLRRLEERIHHEAAQPGGFVSDGSVIHEWIYGEARMRFGINPNAGILRKLVSELAGLPVKPFYKTYMAGYGALVKARAKRMYDAYVHLPVEFPLPEDGHRPVSERFRHASDALLIETLDALEIPYIIIRGSIAQRLSTIIEHFGLPIAVPIDVAVQTAETRVAQQAAEIRRHAEAAARDRNRSWWRKIKYAFRY